MAECLEIEDDRDINDSFNSIVMIEQKISADGFREGFEKGQQSGTEDGYRLGHRHGLNLGTELGYYRGTASSWLDVSSRVEGQVSEKAKNSLEKVVELLDKFPQVLTADMDVNSEVDKVRAAYKKACSLLKIETASPSSTKISF